MHCILFMMHLPYMSYLCEDMMHFISFKMHLPYMSYLCKDMMHCILFMMPLPYMSYLCVDMMHCISFMMHLPSFMSYLFEDMMHCILIFMMYLPYMQRYQQGDVAYFWFCDFSIHRQQKSAFMNASIVSTVRNNVYLLFFTLVYISRVIFMEDHVRF